MRNGSAGTIRNALAARQSARTTNGGNRRTMRRVQRPNAFSECQFFFLRGKGRWLRASPSPAMACDTFSSSKTLANMFSACLDIVPSIVSWIQPRPTKRRFPSFFDALLGSQTHLRHLASVRHTVILASGPCHDGHIPREVRGILPTSSPRLRMP